MEREEITNPTVKQMVEFHKKGVEWLKALENTFNLPGHYDRKYAVWLSTAVSAYEKWIDEYIEWAKQKISSEAEKSDNE